MLTEALQGPVIDFHIFILMTIKDIPANSHYLEALSLFFCFSSPCFFASAHHLSFSLSLTVLCFSLSHGRPHRWRPCCGRL